MIATRCLAVIALLAACACDRDASESAAIPSPSEMLPPPSSGSAAPSGSAPVSTAVAPPSPASAATATSTSDGGADAGPTCGAKPLPDCPLQTWMKQNMTPPLMAKDYQGIASSLMKTAAFAPPGYTNWASIAKDGADAARAADLDAVKAACRGCHEQYKNKYRGEMRSRPVP